MSDKCVRDPEGDRLIILGLSVITFWALFIWAYRIWG